MVMVVMGGVVMMMMLSSIQECSCIHAITSPFAPGRSNLYLFNDSNRLGVYWPRNNLASFPKNTCH